MTSHTHSSIHTSPYCFILNTQSLSDIELFTKGFGDYYSAYFVFAIYVASSSIQYKLFCTSDAYGSYVLCICASTPSNICFYN